MKSILDETAGSPGSNIPSKEIDDLIASRDVVSLVSKSYFATTIRSLYSPVMDFIDNQDMVQQVMVTVYYQENQPDSTLQAIKTSLVSAFQECGAGSIALAELMFKHSIVLTAIFRKLTEITILDSESMVISFEKLNAPSTQYFFEVVTAALSSFTLHYEHLVAFINYLLTYPASFDSLVSLSGYPCFQSLLETLFTVKLNRTKDVTSKIASAWREGCMGSRMLSCLIHSFSYKIHKITCVDLTRSIADLLIKGLLLDIDYIVESVLEAIPELTRIIMFSDQAIAANMHDPADYIRLRVDAFHSLVDLWICAVRCLMIRLHQSAISIYSYQDNPSYASGTIVTLSDMKQNGILVADIFHQFVDALQSGDLFLGLVGDYLHPPLVHLTLHKLTAIGRLLCVAGDIRSFYYFKTCGYYPTDHFMDPENTHSTNNHQIGRIYGALPPTAHITIIGSDDIPIEELCQTDTGAIIEGSMFGIVTALLHANVHTFVSSIFSNQSNDLQCILSLCTAISSLLLEYRFMIPQLADKVVANEYATTLFSNALERIHSHISLISSTGTKRAFTNRNELRLPVRIVFVCCLVENLYKMLNNEGDRKQLISKRLLSLQNIKISFTSESQRQKRGPDPLVPFFSEDSVICNILSTIHPHNQKELFSIFI